MTIETCFSIPCYYYLFAVDFLQRFIGTYVHEDMKTPYEENIATYAQKLDEYKSKLHGLLSASDFNLYLSVISSLDENEDLAPDVLTGANEEVQELIREMFVINRKLYDNIIPFGLFSRYEGRTISKRTIGSMRGVITRFKKNEEKNMRKEKEEKALRMTKRRKREKKLWERKEESERWEREHRERLDRLEREQMESISRIEIWERERNERMRRIRERMEENGIRGFAQLLGERLGINVRVVRISLPPQPTRIIPRVTTKPVVREIPPAA